MNIEKWLNKSARLLGDADVPTARLDSVVLLEDITGKDRAWLLAHPDFNLTRSDLVRLNKAIKRRVAHEPLAYIRGKSEFYGREFKVTPDTLQPRSETETMIALLRDLVEGENLKVESKTRIIDVGTGSGCLAITAKLEWPEAEVYATEINEAALEVAKNSAKTLKADVKFYKGNLLQPILSIVYSLSSIPTILLCNLPYVPDSHTINQAATQEPKIAIFGGEDGLDLYREMFKQLKDIGARGEDGVLPTHIFTESLPFQHEELTKIAKSHGYKQAAEDDFIQVFQIKKQ